jgi:hypothetical protein
LTGPDAGTNFGVVVTFRLPVAVVVGFVLAALELDDEEDEDELEDDPHPASATSAAQSESVARRRLICAATLA